MDGSYRKQREWVEAGILPLNYSRSSGFHKPGKQSHLLTTPKLARVTIHILALTIIVLIHLIRYTTTTLPVPFENGRNPYG
jgi:hypothetical protein